MTAIVAWARHGSGPGNDRRIVYATDRVAAPALVVWSFSASAAEAAVRPLRVPSMYHHMLI